MQLEKALKRVLLADKAAAGTKSAFPGGFGGKWKNELGSVADFSVNGYAVSGTYISAVSGIGASIAGPISGFASDDIIAFTVNWPTTLGSMTAWVGQVVDVQGVQTLKTLWHLIRNIEDSEEPSGAWAAILAGADEFTKLP
jgi:hypothetical protein